MICSQTRRTQDRLHMMWWLSSVIIFAAAALSASMPSPAMNKTTKPSTNKGMKYYQDCKRAILQTPYDIPGFHLPTFFENNPRHYYSLPVVKSSGNCVVTAEFAGGHFQAEGSYAMIKRELGDLNEICYEDSIDSTSSLTGIGGGIEVSIYPVNSGLGRGASNSSVPLAVSTGSVGTS